MVLVGAMDGAVCFLADLMRALSGPDDVTTARMRRYEGSEAGESQGHLACRSATASRGMDVLIVEGIVDTGETCALLGQRLCRTSVLHSVRVCALLDKPSRRTNEVRTAYRGFDVPDVFVVGYGMDYDGAYRSLRDVHVLERDGSVVS